MKKRTIASILLLLALLFLSIAGFGNAYAMLQSPDYGSPLFAAIAFCYGIAALVTAVGLWRQRTWTIFAYSTWAGITLGGMLLFQIEFAQMPWLKFTISLIVFATVLWGLGRYVRRAVKTAL